MDKDELNEKQNRRFLCLGIFIGFAITLILILGFYAINKEMKSMENVYAMNYTAVSATDNINILSMDTYTKAYIASLDSRAVDRVNVKQIILCGNNIIKIISKDGSIYVTDIKNVILYGEE